LGNRSQLGCDFQYAIQEKSEGLVQAFIIVKEFIQNDDVCLILGDNLFHGDGFKTGVKNAVKSIQNELGGVVFAYHVKDPQRYGVVTFDKNKNVIDIKEKPTNPKSSYAIPGIYFFDNQVIEMAPKVIPSSRGEFEIREIHNLYLKQNQLKVEIVDRGNPWLDTGTMDSMLEATQFVQVVEKRQNYKIGCIKETAYKQGFITKMQLEKLAKPLLKNE
jgi:glucose-1-phosphate thymidylyltransferase